MELNIVFILDQSFPVGFAMSKRHKYLIDYLNEKNISSGLVQTRTSNDIFDNPMYGSYGKAEYANLSCIWKKGLSGKIKYFKEVIHFLKRLYKKDRSNILIFPSIVQIDVIPFYIYARLKGYKIVFDVVENYSVEGSNSSFLHKISCAITNRLYESSLCLFVISNPLQKVISEIAPNIPVCILSNSAPITASGVKLRYSSPVRILYSGTFSQKDGLDYMIKAYLEFLKKSEIKSEFLLTGKGRKKDMERVFTLINGCLNIRYLGYVSDVELEQLIGSSDILTMTRCNSKFANYGFPFKLSEYLASGNTVLATKVGDVPLYLSHKENAYLADSEDVESLVDALLFLTSNQEVAIGIGRNGIATVRQYFDVQLNGKRFVDFLNYSLAEYSGK